MIYNSDNINEALEGADQTVVKGLPSLQNVQYFTSSSGGSTFNITPSGITINGSSPITENTPLSSSQCLSLIPLNDDSAWLGSGAYRWKETHTVKMYAEKYYSADETEGKTGTLFIPHTYGDGEVYFKNGLLVGSTQQYVGDTLVFGFVSD